MWCPKEIRRANGPGVLDPQVSSLRLNSIFLDHDSVARPGTEVCVRPFCFRPVCLACVVLFVRPCWFSPVFDFARDVFAHFVSSVFVSPVFVRPLFVRRCAPAFLWRGFLFRPFLCFAHLCVARFVVRPWFVSPVLFWFARSFVSPVICSFLFFARCVSPFCLFTRFVSPVRCHPVDLFLFKAPSSRLLVIAALQILPQGGQRCIIKNWP